MVPSILADCETVSEAMRYVKKGRTISSFRCCEMVSGIVVPDTPSEIHAAAFSEVITFGNQVALCRRYQPRKNSNTKYEPSA